MGNVPAALKKYQFKKSVKAAKKAAKGTKAAPKRPKKK